MKSEGPLTEAFASCVFLISLGLSYDIVSKLAIQLLVVVELELELACAARHALEVYGIVPELCHRYLRLY